MPELYVVGIGDDGAAGLSPRARALVSEAEVLCGGDRQLAFFPEHPAARLPFRGGLGSVLDALDRRRRDSRVVVLASGDPLLFGIGATLIERFGAAAVDVVPAVSSAQLAFARLGLPWHDATLLSAHGRPLAAILPAARAQPKVAVFTDPTNTPARIARALLAAGSDDCAATVFEHLGGPGERAFAGRLSDLLERDFDPLNLLVLQRDPPAPRPRLGFPDDAYEHQRGMLTKREVRAVSLAALALRTGSILWDVGAGSGAVGIEATALIGDGTVYAIERRPDQIELLRRNLQRHLAPNVRVVPGEAPEALADLPDPDSVFVGGSGGRLTDILGQAAGRLRPGGAIVVNAATFETIEGVRAFARQAGWALEVTQVAIARGTEVGDALRLEALNPIFVLSLSRGGGE